MLRTWQQSRQIPCAAPIRRLLKNTGLFCRMQVAFVGLFCKRELYSFHAQNLAAIKANSLCSAANLSRNAVLRCSASPSHFFFFVCFSLIFSFYILNLNYMYTYRVLLIYFCQKVQRFRSPHHSDIFFFFVFISCRKFLVTDSDLERKIGELPSLRE